MDSDILQDIKVIRKGVERANRMSMAFIAIFLAAMIFITGIGSLNKDQFDAEATKLFESADYEKLGELIAKRKSERPNDPEVYLYLAKIQIINGKNEEALKNLAYLKVLAPRWEENTIKPLLDSIQNSASNKSLKDAP